MAKLMSKKTKETVQTVSVLVVAILIIVFYIIYPLIIVPKLTARPDRKKFDDRNYQPVNDPAAFINAGLSPDTFTVISDDNLRLAGLYFSPGVSPDREKGTVILLHPDDTDGTAMIQYINPLLDSGLSAVVYDQRASGFSQGRYRSPGTLESDDLTEVMSFLNLRGKLFKPIIVVGFGIGADAAMNASQSEKRISEVIAVNPYLTSNRWIAERKSWFGALTIPFSETVYLWWYQKLSGYPSGWSDPKKLPPISVKTVLLADQKSLNSEEIKHLKEISSGELLDLQPMPDSQEMIRQKILELIYRERGL